MTRRCSHCSNNGHNSRTCPTRGVVKLFGVRLTDGSIKKSASMGSLSSSLYYSSSSAAASPSPNPSSPSSDPLRDPTPIAEGYASDGPAQTSCSSNCRAERKKGVPWTEKEHQLFLIGLLKLGKGDWRGIARNFVMSRTPTQVASHAQKYFIRQSNATRRKRRASLFDMVPAMAIDSPQMADEYFLHPSSMLGETENAIDFPQMADEHFLLPSSKPREAENVNQIPPLSLTPNPKHEPTEPMSIETHMEAEETVSSWNFTQMIPAVFPKHLPFPFPFWSPNLAPAIEGKEKEISSQHRVLRPIPLLPKDPVNVDELVAMSQLSLGETASGHMKPSSLSVKLLGAPSRQSAFQANFPVSGSDLSKSNGSAIHAV